MGTGTTSSTVALGNHTHSLSMSQTGTASINLAANTVYTLTAGGSTYAFKTPPDNNTYDSWTSTATVTSSGTVAFSGLNDNYGYELYCKNKLLGVSAISKSGSGTSVTLTYTVTGAATGDVCKLRILK